MRIFGKIAGAMAGVALVPVGGMWYAAHRVEVHSGQEVNRSLSTAAGGLAAKAEGWWDTNVNALQQNAASPDMASMDPARQVPVVRNLTATYPHLYLAFATGRDGTDVARSDDKPHAAFGDRGYFHEVMRGAPLSHELLMGRTSGKPTIVFAAPILGADRMPVGALVASAQLKKLTDAVAGVALGTTGAAWVLDPTGRLIAASKRSAIVESRLQSLAWHPAMEADQALDQPLRYEWEGAQVVARRVKTKQGWTVIVQQDYDEAFAPLLGAKRDALVTLAAALALSLALALALSRRLARPIGELTKVAENISIGKTDVKVSGTQRADEIGALARAIERLGMSTQRAVERLRAV